MGEKSKVVCKSFDEEDIPSKQWGCVKKGLRKELISFEFKSMTKPTELSNCHVIITEVENLNQRESTLLSKRGDFWVTLSTALTPIDYYIEIFLQEMFAGETSRCFIQTKSSETIKFKIQLLDIDFNNYIFRLTVREMYDHAVKLKENGVQMFKNYPIFAHEYFCRAAKCLMSYKPFDVLDSKTEGVDPKQLDILFHNIQNNIAACLIKEQRYDEIIHLTEFVENCADEQIKAVYRRSLAFYKLKKFEKSKEILEKVDYKNNRELLSLYNTVLIDWKKDNEKYNNLVKKMFQ